MTTCYITTPIYYVNDRPHLGHCYTTLVADVAARFARLLGRDTFFLTGTDEHAEKVARAAASRNLSPQQWADRNAESFKDAFRLMHFAYDDFIRTSEDRHKSRATAYIAQLIDSGDIELGQYVGWWDSSQEEYVTESTAREHAYKSPVTGEPLEKRSEENYFFRLDRYQQPLLDLIDSGRFRILPDARRNEVVSRIRQGLQKVPVSRRISGSDPDWGVRMPGDEAHRVYVWIEALCNYLTAVDTDDRRKYWPANVHFMAKDILWFHAVIWPAMLIALGRDEKFRSRFGANAPEDLVPRCVYAHAYFVAEGRKMSKSLGNFIEIDQLRAYSQRYSTDAVRWYLATQGPLGATDADFAHARFVDVYNADLANGIGNCASRVANMIAKYFDGNLPDPGQPAGDTGGTPVNASSAPDLPDAAARAADDISSLFDDAALDKALSRGSELIRAVDGFINQTAPFKLAKQLDEDPSVRAQLAAILYNCAEAIRIASLLLYPALPEKMAELWRRWNCSPLDDPQNPDSGFKAPLAQLAQWGGPHSLKPGTTITKGDPLFMRADPADPPPGAS